MSADRGVGRGQPAGLGSLSGYPDALEPVTHSLWVTILSELAKVAPMVKDEPACRIFSEVRSEARHLLCSIRGLIREDEIRPWSLIRLSASDPQIALTANMLRIGVFPVSASPLVWGHILAGLSAIAHLRLDRVVYVICGQGRRPEWLLPEEFRHAMSREVLRLFSPLLAYSPLRLGMETEAEAAPFLFLQLNARQTIDTYLLSCRFPGESESCSEAECVGRLEKAVKRRSFGYDSRIHPFSVVFFGPDEPDRCHETRLPMYSLPFPCPGAVLPEMRAAALEPPRAEALAVLPHTVLRHLHRLRVCAGMSEGAQGPRGNGARATRECREAAQDTREPDP